jgi:1-aminocyclopropane-1-carboxylate deaminase/D-cysteine desulfhydrase-like pyridoxal-dependent ACC family enzyme
LQVEKVTGLAKGVLDLLGVSSAVNRDAVRVDDRFTGPGYGIPTEATMDAIRTLALDEGVVLDPVYTGKAMAGLIAHAREGRLTPSDTVIFVHTGGAPALFAYNQETFAALGMAV